MKNTKTKTTLQKQHGTAVNKKYKDRLFRMIFNQKEELLELYNALNGTKYDDPQQLEINTLENAIYMSMRNDISFLIDSSIQTLYEHQSTYNPNLPLRYLMYIADLYSGMTKDENLYGSKEIILPTPRFLIFYNGVQEQPERKVLKLSDMYTIPEKNPSLELTALMLNINKGHNRKLLKSCKTLGDYAEYTARVRLYAKQMPTEDAVERAITECIAEGILKDFLTKYRAEAKKVSIYEYDEEKHMRMEREQNHAEGFEKGERLGLQKGEKIGKKLGEEQMGSLAECLVKAGRSGEISKAVSDENYRQKLYEECKRQIARLSLN